MGGHVVGTLVNVAVERVSIWDQTIEEGVQIAPHVWIGIFLDDERCRCVVDEHVSEPGDDARFGHNGFDGGCDVMEAAAPGLDAKVGLIHALYLLPP